MTLIFDAGAFVAAERGDRRCVGGQGMDGKFAACYMCLMPQTMCRRADPEAGEQEADGCQYRDLVLPLCWGAFTTAAFRPIITKEFGSFANSDEYMRALGGMGSLGGEPCSRKHSSGCLYVCVTN
jgi:hypothetical protein